MRDFLCGNGSWFIRQQFHSEQAAAVQLRQIILKGLPQMDCTKVQT